MMQKKCFFIYLPKKSVKIGKGQSRKEYIYIQSYLKSPAATLDLKTVYLVLFQYSLVYPLVIVHVLYNNSLSIQQFRPSVLTSRTTLHN